MEQKYNEYRYEEPMPTWEPLKEMVDDLIQTVDTVLARSENEKAAE